MPKHRILAEEVVSISEMRKHPTDFFTDHPVAVLNRNQTEGYMVGRELFETMMDLIRQIQPAETFTARFQPSVTHLKKIASDSATFLATAKEKDLADFVE